MLDAIQEMVMTCQAGQGSAAAKSGCQSFAAIYQLFAEQDASVQTAAAAEAELLEIKEEPDPPLAAGMAQEEDQKDKIKDSKCDKSPFCQQADGFVSIHEGFGLLDQLGNEPVFLAAEQAARTGTTVLPAADAPERPAAKTELFSDIAAWMPSAEVMTEKQVVQPPRRPYPEKTNAASKEGASSLANANKIAADQLPVPARPAGSQLKLTRFFAAALASSPEKKPTEPDTGHPAGLAGLAVAGQLPEQPAGKTQLHLAATEPGQVSHQPGQILAQLVEAITASKNLAGQTCVLDLKPEHLGKVRIQLSLAKGEIKALVQVENAAAGQLIREQSGQLQELLQEKGINLATFDVSQSSVLADGRQQPQERHWQQKNSAGRLKNPGGSLNAQAGPLSLYTAAGPLPARLNLYSSVEFRA